MNSKDPTATNRLAYDQMAPRFAERNAAMLPYVIEAGERLLNGIPTGSRVLDLGCGAGRDLAWFETKGGRIMGADLSMGMLAQARKSANGPLIQLDMLRLPFKPESFAGVWCQAALLHLPKAMAPEALREIWRALAYGGLLHVSVQRGETEGFETRPYEPEERYYAHYTPDELSILLAAAGFTVEHLAEAESRRPWVWASARKNED